MHDNPSVLLISGHGAESTKLESILRTNVRLLWIANLDQLDRSLERDTLDAVFCEWSFRNGVLEQVQEKRPRLPVIVFCHVGGEQEWMEVLEAGGFDLLTAPYRESPVLPALAQAVASHEARRLRAELSLSVR